MKRYVETWVQLRWLWLAAFLLWALLALLVWRSYAPEYEILTRLWITDTIGGLPALPEAGWPLSPSSKRNLTLREFLLTDDFIARMSEQTSLASFATTRDARASVRLFMVERMTARTLGENLLEVRIVADSPELGMELMRASLTTLDHELLAITRAQTDLALAFYQPRLRQLEREWQAAADAVRGHLGSDPDFATTERSGRDLSIADLQLQQLQQRENQARRTYDDTREIVDRIQLTASATDTALRVSSVVVDEPITSVRPDIAWQTISIRIAAITCVFFAAGLAVILMVTWTDGSLHGSAEASARLGVPTLGNLPAVHRRSGRRPARLLAWARPAN